MFRRFFRDAADMRFENMIAVEVWHLAIRLDPNAVFSMPRNHVKRCNMQPELASFCELANGCAECLTSMRDPNSQKTYH